jgi:hypothetical protein
MKIVTENGKQYWAWQEDRCEMIDEPTLRQIEIKEVPGDIPKIGASVTIPIFQTGEKQE